MNARDVLEQRPAGQPHPGEGRLRDSALGFWLRWTEREGALHEPDHDATLVVLPTALQDTLDLPDEVVVTANPEVAREEHGLLLAAGHPALDRATEEVLRRGDVGHDSLATPAAAIPDATSLLSRAREAFPVDHGRIDLTGVPVREHVPVLRVGALVTYAVGLDERFQERAEAWIEVPGQVSLPAEISTVLAQYPRDQEMPATAAPDGLVTAVAAAHQRLADTATARQEVLASHADTARADEVTRTRAYYDDVVAGLDRRRQAATAERRGMLDAKLNATRAERARRLAEIEEKFRPAHTIRLFRLHVLWVPALRLPCVVQRGHREFPLTLRWLRPTRAFLPACCPHCGALENLVVAKDRLGCRRCLPRSAALAVVPPEVVPPNVTSTPAAASTSGSPPPGPAVPAAPPGPTASGSETANAARRAPAAGGRPGRSKAADRQAPAPVPPDRGSRRETDHGQLVAAGDKLALRFWEAVAGGDRRRLRRLLAPGTPAAALHQLYGAPGPAWVIGCEPADGRSITTTTVVDEFPPVTCGVVQTARSAHPYTLRWTQQTAAPAVIEVLAVSGAVGLRLPRLPAPSVPPPLVQLDPVANALWAAPLPVGGPPLVIRCLTAWWRVADELSLSTHTAPTLAAAVTHQVARRAGFQLTYAETADAYAVDESEVRAAAGDVKRMLGLSGEQYW